MKRGGQVKDVSGQVFGRLTVLSREGFYRHNATWRCLCECGKETVVLGVSLRVGKTKSCGCLQKEIVTKQGFDNKVHGLCGTATYFTWESMLQRCNKTSHKSYHQYGGRGITVCERWHTFSNFLEDMGVRPDGTTLDREDNSKGYFPGNCRWVSIKVQQRNRRSNRLVTAYGETKPLRAWTEDARCKPKEDALRWRLKQGMTPEQAMEKDVRVHVRKAIA